MGHVPSFAYRSPPRMEQLFLKVTLPIKVKYSIFLKKFLIADLESVQKRAKQATPPKNVELFYVFLCASLRHFVYYPHPPTPTRRYVIYKWSLIKAVDVAAVS